MTVRISLWVASVWSPLIILWWHQVTVTPEESKITVFNRGTSKGLKGITPLGGHAPPSSMDGARLLWKKAQKKLIKKRTSEAINKSIPARSPVSTSFVWNPSKAPSKDTSRHHWALTSTIINMPVKNKEILFWWNHIKIPEVRNNPPKLLKNGQGDSCTRWWLWRTNLLIRSVWGLLTLFKQILLGL